MAPRKKIENYADDDTTQTLSIIADTTELGCYVEERTYSYIEEDDESCEIPETKEGTEITLSCPVLDDQVLRSLEDLAAECHGSPEIDI